jgi:hypothetical protein
MVRCTYNVNCPNVQYQDIDANIYANCNYCHQVFALGIPHYAWFLLSTFDFWISHYNNKYQSKKNQTKGSCYCYSGRYIVVILVRTTVVYVVKFFCTHSSSESSTSLNTVSSGEFCIDVQLQQLWNCYVQEANQNIYILKLMEGYRDSKPSQW